MGKALHQHYVASRLSALARLLPLHKEVLTKTMPTLTPGAKFLITISLPSVLCPPCVIHALLVVLSQFWPTLSPSHFLLACIYILPLPVYVSLRSRIARFKETLGARRLQARVAPRIRGMLLGNVDLIYSNLTAGKTDYIGEPWLAGFQDHGKTFTLEILGEDRIFTINPRNIQKVLATDFDNYCKGVHFNGIMKTMLGDGVFNSDGDMWQFHRKMTRPFFTKERVTDLELYERNTAVALQKMQDRFDAKMPIDFQDLVSRFTLDCAAEFLLGVSTKSLHAPLALPFNSPSAEDNFANTASTRFSRAFAAAQVTLLRRAEIRSLWPLAEIFQDEMKGPMTEINSFIEPIVRSAIAKREKGDNAEQTLLQHLLDVTDDMKVIVDETLNVMLAGRDTTASLLTFVTYLLAMHPEVLSRLRGEIIDVLRGEDIPSYDKLREMKYLRAVLNETLRLFPPVPFNLRETINETTWFDDQGGEYYVAPHTSLAYSVFHLHRDEEYWGPDAHIFDPDRWLDSRVSYYTSNPFIFIPFNAGPRICLGQQFAYHEASFFLVRLLQRFSHIELAPEFQPPNTRPPANWKHPATGSPLAKRRAMEECFPRSHLTLYADGGLWIRASQSEAIPEAS